MHRTLLVLSASQLQHPGHRYSVQEYFCLPHRTDLQQKFGNPTNRGDHMKAMFQMILKRSGLTLITGSFLLLTSCATIINGTTQTIPVNSTPDGATVKVGDVVTATTPATLELKRNTPHVLAISKEGYRPETVTLTRVMSGAVAGNIA